jgi:hypothetical protein
MTLVGYLCSLFSFLKILLFYFAFIFWHKLHQGYLAFYHFVHHFSLGAFFINIFPFRYWYAPYELKLLPMFG